MKPPAAPAEQRLPQRRLSSDAEAPVHPARGADEGEAGARTPSDDEIDQWRRRIDLIDGQLMSLLNSRSACAVEIGRIKRRLGLPVYSPEREAWILERVMRDNPGPLDPMAVKRVFERVIDESRRLERLAAEGPEPEPGPGGDGKGD